MDQILPEMAVAYVYKHRQITVLRILDVNSGLLSKFQVDGSKLLPVYML